MPSAVLLYFFYIHTWFLKKNGNIPWTLFVLDWKKPSFEHYFHISAYTDLRIECNILINTFGNHVDILTIFSRIFFSKLHLFSYTKVWRLHKWIRYLEKIALSYDHLCFFLFTKWFILYIFIQLMRLFILKNTWVFSVIAANPVNPSVIFV